MAQDRYALLRREARESRARMIARGISPSASPENAISAKRGFGSGLMNEIRDNAGPLTFIVAVSIILFTLYVLVARGAFYIEFE